MSRTCELTGKTVQYGNKVSHANNKTRRRFLPNLFNITLVSDTLKERFNFKVSAYGLRTVEHRGGLDEFLQKADVRELSQRARLLKKRLSKEQKNSNQL